MRDLDRISSSTLRDIVSLLRDADIAKVRWSYIWYDDQADPDQIECFDVYGNPIDAPSWLASRLESDIYDITSEFGDYELNAYTGEVEYIGGEPWRIPVSRGGPPRDDYDVSPINEEDLITCAECGKIVSDESELTDDLCDDCLEELERENGDDEE